MEDKFDNYLKHEINSISNSPVISEHWDKEKTWSKIAKDLQSKPKLISITWLYVAASIAFVVLLGASVLYKNYNSQITSLKNENSKLLKMTLAKNISTKQYGYKHNKTICIIQTKEKIKKVFISNTIHIHDTITMLPIVTEPQPAIVASHSHTISTDSCVALSTNVPKNRSKVHFVIANDIVTPQEDDKLTLILSKSLYQKEPREETPHNTLEIALN
jgi:hypothetical protein